MLVRPFRAEVCAYARPQTVAALVHIDDTILPVEARWWKQTNVGGIEIVW
jgi:hypothetical protein